LDQANINTSHTQGYVEAGIGVSLQTYLSLNRDVNYNTVNEDSIREVTEGSCDTDNVGGENFFEDTSDPMLINEYDSEVQIRQSHLRETCM
jgi:hypothetical protein